MNRIVLSGNVCKDIELRNTTSGVEAVSNTIAVKRNYKNANGEYDTDFINFVAYKNNAEYLNKYVRKGAKILIEGRINTRNYENEQGNKVYVTEVIVDRIEQLTFANNENNDNNKEKVVDPTQEYDDINNEKEVSIINDLDLPF